MNGAIISTYEYTVGDGPLQTCRSVQALTPTNERPRPGCPDCEYTWRIEFQNLQSTCDFFANDDERLTRDVGVDLGTDQLRLFNLEVNAWGGYSGEGASENNTYAGSFSDENPGFVDLNFNGQLDNNEPSIQRSTEVFIINWTDIVRSCGNNSCDFGETQNNCIADCNGVNDLSPAMTGALITTQSFDPEQGQYQSCENVSVISPGGNPLAGCPDCDKKWLVRIQTLTSTCGAWADDNMVRQVHLGLNVEQEALRINHNDGIGWGNYAGEGRTVRDGLGYVGSYESEPRPADYDQDGQADGTYSSTETFLLN